MANVSDDLQGFSAESRRCVAEADALRAQGLRIPREVARFASLMFEAGYNQAQADMAQVLKGLCEPKGPVR